MNKTAIKNFAVWARRKLIADITYKAGLIGITEKGIAEPLSQSTKDMQFFDIGTKNYAEVSGGEIAQRKALVSAIKAKERDTDYKTAFQNVVEEIAYTWFNRMIAVRFMEVNDYLPSRIRVLSSENAAKLEPDFVTTPFDTDLSFTPYEQDRVLQLKDENKLDELFRLLFIKQCNKLGEILPELFEKTSDYTELLLTISFTDKDGVVYHLTHDIAEDDFNVLKEGQVEIIGWMYQYYNTEPKDEVFALLKKNVKITKERIPAATQLFTPDWIVRYMVENSLGRLWIEGHENNSLKDSWKYYLDEAKQEPEVEAQLAKIREEYKTIKPEEIKVIDPCMGSGHILVYAFDVLMQIYTSQGYVERDAAKSIVENNIYGLDIDTRAYQLAYFAVMMKARQYNRRILSSEIKSNLYAIDDSSVLNAEIIGFIANGNGALKKDLQSIADDLYNAKEYGSIIDVAPVDFAAIYARIDEIKDGISLEKNAVVNYALPIIKQAEAMAQKYDVVVTNPPYMGSSGMSAKLSDYVKTNYPDSKSDLFACFIEKGNSMARQNYYNCMVTMQSWMFLSSFEKMRTSILDTKCITNLMHMENMVMGIAFGTAVTVFRNCRLNGYKGTYNQIKLQDIDDDSPKVFPIAGNRFAQVSTDNFSKIPGSPIAYWVSDTFIETFERGTKLGDIADSKQGLATADNNRFLREWYEVDNRRIKFDVVNREDAEKSRKRWFPYNKGGEFRKWYGNNDFVVNWENDGFEIRNFYDEKGKLRSRPQNTDFYFRESASWSLISSGVAAFRYKPYGHIFDVAGMSFFSGSNLKFLLALCNTPYATEVLKIIAPTINYQCGDIACIPVIYNKSKKETIEEIVERNIEVSKIDWDSFETSWDFTEHPLIKWAKELWDCTAIDATLSKFYGEKKPKEVSNPLELCYLLWQGECSDRFNTLKVNEEELNRIFIDIYGLQDELTPEVEDKGVTVRKADKTRDIKSLISYAVGCMFGRYSLDVDGLAYAGGEWDESKYKSFIPDADNCIPITDEEYFGDDIVGRFVQFVKTAFGEETLEENLDFIASALGGKGNTSREIIRGYFLNDFIRDHIKIYQKRPIYWMFDSGKQNGFKALVYMHRYNADTVGNVRVEYLHRVQRVYEKEIIRMQETIDNSTNAREIAAAEKRKEKLTKQLKEAKDYDAKIAHIALSRIDIDLDDGVKVNYEKVQTGQDGKKIDILTKIQ